MHTVLRGRRFIREILGWCSWGQFQSVMKTMKTFVPRAGGQKWCQPCNEYLFFFFLFPNPLFARNLSTEVLCNTEMETKREHQNEHDVIARIIIHCVSVCPASSFYMLVTLYTPFPHLSVNCRWTAVQANCTGACSRMNRWSAVSMKAHSDWYPNPQYMLTQLLGVGSPT